MGVTLFTAGVRGRWSATSESMVTPFFMFDTTSTKIGRLPVLRPISTSSVSEGLAVATFFK